MPRSWRWISFIGMPERSASEMSRPIASTSAISAPPALPRLMNTSNGWPRSSSVMVTYSVPSGVSSRRVVPWSSSGRERFWRRWRFSASSSCTMLPESLDLRLELGELALELGDGRRPSRGRRVADSAGEVGPGAGLPLERGLLLHLLGRRAGGEHLHVAAAVAVDRHALAVELVGQPVDLLDVLLARVVREVAASSRSPSRSAPGTPPACGCATRA